MMLNNNSTLTEEAIQQYIRESFEQNYEALRMEGGHPLTPDMRSSALEQVFRYWQKLKDIAENVTETEVKLTLPDRETPEGRRYNIEGVVDIVRALGSTRMYDLKTHEASFVRGNLAAYEAQLNVYAYIWQELRGERLEETAIIATALPESLEVAIDNGDTALIERELEAWDPLVRIPVDIQHVHDTIQEFGAAVDDIENKRFSPASLEKLRSRQNGKLFATQICRNCDVRFSCDSYREYAMGSRRGRDSKVVDFFTGPGEKAAQESRVAVNLEVAPPRG